MFTHDCRDVGSCDRQVQMLEIDVSIVDMRISTVVSQSKPLTPLCPSSCHVPHIHKSWPCSVVSRLATLSKHNIPIALDELCNRYELANAHPQTILFLREAASNFWQAHSQPLDSLKAYVLSCFLSIRFSGVWCQKL